MGKERASEDSFTRRFFKNDLTQSSPKSGEDRRRAIRFTIDNHRIACYRNSLISKFGLKKNIAYSVVDLSASGIRLKTVEPLVLSSRVMLELALDQFSDSFQANGEVRWVRKLPLVHGVQHHDVGIEFVDLNEPQQKKLNAMQSWFTSPQRQAKAKSATEKEKRSFFFPT